MSKRGEGCSEKERGLINGKKRRKNRKREGWKRNEGINKEQRRKNGKREGWKRNEEGINKEQRRGNK